MIGGGESRSLTNRATHRRRGANNAAHVTGLLTGLGDGGLLIHRRSWLLTAAGVALPLLAVRALAATAAATFTPPPAPESANLRFEPLTRTIPAGPGHVENATPHRRAHVHRRTGHAASTRPTAMSTSGAARNSGNSVYGRTRSRTGLR
jgi:hypothetical protein